LFDFLPNQKEEGDQVEDATNAERAKKAREALRKKQEFKDKNELQIEDITGEEGKNANTGAESKRQSYSDFEYAGFDINKDYEL